MRSVKGYTVNDLYHKRTIFFRVKFYLVKIKKSQLFPRPFIKGSRNIALKLGVFWKLVKRIVPRYLQQQSPILEDYFLRTDGASDNGLATGGVIRTKDGKNISNILSFYGEGSNNIAETIALVEGNFYCQSLITDNIYINCESSASDKGRNVCRLPRPPKSEEPQS